MRRKESEGMFWVRRDAAGWGSNPFREGVGCMGEGVCGLHSVLGFRLDGLREGAWPSQPSWPAVPNCPEDLVTYTLFLICLRLPFSRIGCIICLYLLHRARVRSRSTSAPSRFPPGIFFSIIGRFPSRDVHFHRSPLHGDRGSSSSTMMCCPSDVRYGRVGVPPPSGAPQVFGEPTIFMRMLFDWPSFNHLFQ